MNTKQHRTIYYGILDGEPCGYNDDEGWFFTAAAVGSRVTLQRFGSAASGSTSTISGRGFGFMIYRMPAGSFGHAETPAERELLLNGLRREDRQIVERVLARHPAMTAAEAIADLTEIGTLAAD